MLRKMQFFKHGSSLLCSRVKQVRNGIRMGGGLAFKFDVNIKRRSLDQHRMILMVTFINELDPVEPLRPCQIAKEILIQVTNEELASLKPESVYKKPKRVNIQVKPYVSSALRATKSVFSQHLILTRKL